MAIGLCAAAAVAACDKKAEAPPSGMPPLERAAPPPAGAQAVHPPTGANAPGEGMPEGLPPGHPPMGAAGGQGMPGMPPGHPPMGAGGMGGGPIVGQTPGGEYDPKATITGQLVVADKIKDKVASGDVIFLVARQDDGTDKGTILGVKRLTAGAWPQPFELDGRDAMQPGTKFAGKVFISARVDKDGDAISKNAGDALGTARVEVPAAGVKVVIDTITQ
jgi:hypothetical protein